MQQTKLDRWLREKYAYITHVYCNTKPAMIPNQVDLEELNIEAGVPFRYRLSSIHYSSIKELVSQLERENITFTSRVGDRKCWYARWINNPKKSFSYRMFWIGVIFAGTLISLTPAPRMLWQYVNEDDSGDPRKPNSTQQEPSISEKFAERKNKLSTFLP